MAFIVENADSQEYVNQNIVRTKTASFLEAGYCESGTNLAQKLTVPTSFSFVFKTSHACKSTVSSRALQRDRGNGEPAGPHGFRGESHGPSAGSGDTLTWSPRAHDVGRHGEANTLMLYSVYIGCECQSEYNTRSPY